LGDRAEKKRSLFLRFAVIFAERGALWVCEPQKLSWRVIAPPSCITRIVAQAFALAQSGFRVRKVEQSLEDILS